jgi:hypothetical protein
MKLIFRILIILAVAGLISGIAFVIVNRTSIAQRALAGLPGDGEGMHRGRGGFNESGPSLERGRDGLEGGSLLGFSGLTKNLTIIAVIVAAYGLLDWLVKRLVSWRNARQLSR